MPSTRSCRSRSRWRRAATSGRTCGRRSSCVRTRSCSRRRCSRARRSRASSRKGSWLRARSRPRLRWVCSTRSRCCAGGASHERSALLRASRWRRSSSPIRATCCCSTASRAMRCTRPRSRSPRCSPLGSSSRGRPGRAAAVGLALALLVLIRPVSQILIVLAPLLLLGRGAWRPRIGTLAAFGVAAVAPLLLWAGHNAVRADDFTVVRGAGHGLPLYRAFVVDRIVSPENGEASRELARAVQEDLLPREPYRSYGIDLDTFFTSGSARMHEDLDRALRPHVGLGRRLRAPRTSRARSRSGASRRRTRGASREIPGGSSGGPSSCPRQRATQTRAGSSRARRSYPEPSEGQPIPSASVSGFISTPDGRFREVWTSPTEHEIYADDPSDARPSRPDEPPRERAPRTIPRPKLERRARIVAQPCLALVPAARGLARRRARRDRRPASSRARHAARACRSQPSWSFSEPRSRYRQRPSTRRRWRRRSCCWPSRDFSERDGDNGPGGSHEARHDAARSERGGHRRRPARVPPARRRRLRHRHRQRLRRRDARDPRALCENRSLAPAERGRRGHAPGRVGDPHGPARRDRLRRGLGDQLRRRRILVAPRRHAQGCPRAHSGAVRRRPRMLATLPAATRRPCELRRADDRSALHPGVSGRQEHDLPRASEGRASRRPGRRDRAGQPQRRRAGTAAAAASVAPDRGPPLLVSVGGAAREEGTRRLAAHAGLRPDRAPAPSRRGVSRGQARRVLRGARDLGWSSRARPRGRLARGRHATSRRPAHAPRARWPVPLPEAGTSLTFETPDLADSAAYAAEASVLVGIDGIVRAEQRVDALEARLARLRTLPRR